MGRLESDTTPATVPFLKWAGGKRWLTNRFAGLLPDEFNTYIEPFLGSAAVYFHLRPESAILSDKNAELINVYQQIKKNWRDVYRALRRHQNLHGKSYYYEERGRERRAAHEQAAQFLYLNRTCWNGLYRVNLRGEFNVPIGTKSTVLLDTDDFPDTASLLKSAKLLVSDFEATINMAKKDDFVFIDPPYVTRHNFNGFIKYNEDIFSWSDQERLAAAVKRAASRGVKVLVTNAAHDCIRQLYKGIGKHIELDRVSVLAADSGNRGDLPPLKWSSVKYGFDQGGLDDGKEEAHGRRDCSEASAGRCADGTGQAGCGRGADDRGDRSYILSVAQ